jgi:AcrR family transcriptional regulator
MKDTKQRILDAAEALFAERGYNGTSLRDITATAAVNLAAVNYHFNSKEALIQAVFRRKLGPLNRQRLEMLDALEAAAGRHAVPLEEWVRIFVGPALRLLSRPQPGGVSFGMLLGRMYSSPAPPVQRLFVEEMKELVGRFAAALRRILPELPPEEVFWRMFFGIGAMAHTLVASWALKTLSEGRAEAADIEGTIDRLTTFLVGGLKASQPGRCARRATTRGRKGRSAGGRAPHRGRAGRPLRSPRR